MVDIDRHIDMCIDICLLVTISKKKVVDIMIINLKCCMNKDILLNKQNDI